jgi:ABC-type polysaccharide/polyol phosphate transport system ATPase subunit
MQPVLEFKEVSKCYRVGQGFASLRAAISGDDFSKATNIHWAVKDVSFKLYPGESLAIIGPNGAGKTTTLKLLSKVTKPTNGVIEVHGRMSALIELGAGFHPDLTGRENIYLNGAILGMRRAEIQHRFDQIVEFAGIGEYLDTPVKRYSSGMYARLGFSIAAHVDPQILLVDEVLAVGDFAFQTKCYARMDELRRNGTSLIFVSHNMDAVRRVCNRGQVMYGGKAVFQGGSDEAVIAYSDVIRNAARMMKMNVPLDGGTHQKVMTFDAEVEKVELLDRTGQPVVVLESGSLAKVAMEVVFHRDVDHPIFAFFIRTPDGQLVFNQTTRWMNIQTGNYSTGDRCRAEFTISMHLLEGTYEIGVDVTSQNLSHFYDRVERAMGFAVRSSNGARGLVDLGATFVVHTMLMDSEPFITEG